MQPVIKLSHVTLEPSLLHAVRDAVATDGKVYASATRVLRIDGEDYTGASDVQTSDVLISKPAIAKAAAALWDAVGQELANGTGCLVEFTVKGEVRTFTPAK